MTYQNSVQKETSDILLFKDISIKIYVKAWPHDKLLCYEWKHNIKSG